MTEKHDGPPEGATALWAAGPWAVKNYSAVCEGDVFSVLFSLDYVLRSFEFARVDGALCLDTPNHPPGATYADRFLSLWDHLSLFPRSQRLVRFDVKSTTGLEAGSQNCLTRLGQHQKTAFYLVSCASDPSFISLIPNTSTAPTRSDEHDFAVSSSKHLAVPGTAYGFLDPEDAGHRMPIGLLTTAIARIRECALAGSRGKVYVNPWTGLTYAGWTPPTVDSLEDLYPHEHTEQYSAFEGVLDLWRDLRLVQAHGEEDVAYDIVGVQPRLADTKIIFKGRQWLVQCKIDARDRKYRQVDKVAIARSQTREALVKGESSWRYYFSSHDRFDWLLYEFRFLNGKNAPTIGIYFLPEYVLPDDFFEEVREVSFDRPEFEKYYRDLVEPGDLAKHVLDIIDEHSGPLRRSKRPHRPSIFQQPTAMSVTSRLHRLRNLPPVPMEPAPVRNKTLCHRRLFAGVMAECAKRLSGALLVLASRHSAGDFGFVPYQWTASERDTFLAAGKPPVTLHDVPAQMPALPVYAFARDVACDWRGPMLSGAEFRRLNSWKAPRLIVFDGVASSAEHLNGAGPLFVVPTTDLCVHPDQLRLFEENANVDKSKDERHARVPLVRDLLHGGCNITDYVISGQGPAIYQTEHDSSWGRLWTLLDQFADTAPFEYPDGTHHRLPQEFRVTVQQLHERSWEEATNSAPRGAAEG